MVFYKDRDIELYKILASYKLWMNTQIQINAMLINFHRKLPL